MRFPFNATIQLMQNHATNEQWQRLFIADVARQTWLYPAYLKSAAWRAKREERITIDGNHCGICLVNAGPLEVHHRTYARIGNENAKTDLVAVCRCCHREEHGIKREIAHQTTY